MLIMIDNYDSFTWNLVQYFGELGQEVAVYRNDQITTDQLGDLSPEFVVISPGPCTPNEAGISVDLVSRYAGVFLFWAFVWGTRVSGRHSAELSSMRNRSCMVKPPWCIIPGQGYSTIWTVLFGQPVITPW